MLKDLTIQLMVGLPRSGKSTVVKHLVQTKGWPVVNRDSIRLAVHGKEFIAKTEDFISYLEIKMVESLYLAGHNNIIIDSTNCTKAKRDRWKQFVGDGKVFYHVCDRSAGGCIRQAKSEGNERLVKTINEMAENYDFEGIVDKSKPDSGFKVWTEEFILNQLLTGR